MSSNTPEWATPMAFFKELDKEFHFTLDPCSTHENAKCEKHYTKEDDGLKQDWGGQSRQGCWFCFNAHIDRYISIRKNHPDWWQQFKSLYKETGSESFKYSSTLEDVELKMDSKEYQDKYQLKLF